MKILVLDLGAVKLIKTGQHNVLLFRLKNQKARVP